MTPEQEAFVAKRADQVRYFPWVGVPLVLAVLGVCSYLYARFPLYANPIRLADALRGNHVDIVTMAKIAGYGSLAMSGCAAFVLIIFMLIFLSLWNEKRLIDIIRAQNGELKGLRVVVFGESEAKTEGFGAEDNRPDQPEESPSTEKPREHGE